MKIIRLKKCIVLMISVVIILVVFVSIVFLKTERGSSGGDARPWAQGGNIVVAYGPVLMPYASSSVSSYYIYSRDGERLDMRKGKGDWPPTVLPVDNDVHLHFAERIVSASTGEEEISFPRLSPITARRFSPDGEFAVGLLNDSQSGKEHYSAVVFTEDNSYKSFLPTSPHSLAVGEDHALMAALSVDGAVDKDNPLLHEKQLFVVSKDGSVNQISFPDGYDLDSPDFEDLHVNYLGNGLFEVKEARSVETGEFGTRNNITSYEVRIKDNYELETIRTVEFSTLVHDDSSVVRALPMGEFGFIDGDGNVYINRRSGEGAEFTGVIEGYDTFDYAIVHSAVEPLFALQKGSKIEIRNWNNPESAVVTIPYDGQACWLETCGLASLTILP